MEIKLEFDQFTTNRALHNIHPTADKSTKTLYETIMKQNEEKIKPYLSNKDNIKNIITRLKGCYKLTLFPGDKEYLDQRILMYQSMVDTFHPINETTNTNTNTKTKKTKISATLKRLVWNTHIGEDIGKYKCVCCNVTDITQLSFHCGHIIAEINGGQTNVSNLKPICQNCNSSMATKNMDDFIKSFK